MILEAMVVVPDDDIIPRKTADALVEFTDAFRIVLGRAAVPIVTVPDCAFKMP